jgi:hypothetical protein
MSYLDLEAMSPENLIAQYVLECRGQGLFLPYKDYQVVAEWLTAAGDPDDLFLVLSEELPKFFADSAAKRGPPGSLAGVRRLVLSPLRDGAMRRADQEQDK